MQRETPHYSTARDEEKRADGGKQIQLEDPDGNAIELFEPAGKR